MQISDRNITELFTGTWCTHKCKKILKMHIFNHKKVEKIRTK